jgi:hypothetical protein
MDGLEVRLMCLHRREPLAHGHLWIEVQPWSVGK